MIPVARVPQPSGFVRARKKGRDWLKAHTTEERLRDYWTPFKSVLADGFGQRCGYLAMLDLVGSVDHFLSVAKHRHLAYEWDNLRFASELMNRIKGTEDDNVLDPFEIGEGWFEVILPSLQMVATDRVPARLRAKAEHTIRRLGLRDDERVLRQRRAWLESHEQGKVTISGLDSFAPLLAAAVRKRDLGGG